MRLKFSQKSDRFMGNSSYSRPLNVSLESLNKFMILYRKESVEGMEQGLAVDLIFSSYE